MVSALKISHKWLNMTQQEQLESSSYSTWHFTGDISKGDRSNSQGAFNKDFNNEARQRKEKAKGTKGHRHMRSVSRYETCRQTLMCPS